jgi:membrane associated rhomboid family serine protease
VLEAAGIPSGMAGAGREHVLLVPEEDAERAAIELFRYVRENRDRVQDDDVPQPIEWSGGAALLYAALFSWLYIAQRHGWFGLDWLASGVADATMIREGAWWRSITALGLHADALHLASNLAFGAVFGVMLAQSIGVGLCWLAFLVTGAAGNWLNAWLQPPSHASIGASTAIFGMLGVQVAHDWVRRRQVHYNLFRRWAPIAIGAALLAWLGGDGRQIDPTGLPKTLGDLNVALPKIDVGAHLLGFAVGLLLGGLIGWTRPRFRLNARQQASLSAAVVGVFFFAWFVALR